MIKLKRAYEAASKDDRLRVLVERLWPRGMSKLKVKIDLWLKALAPSTELRQWYGHDLLDRARAPGRLVGVRHEPAAVEGGNVDLPTAGPGEMTPG